MQLRQLGCLLWHRDLVQRSGHPRGSSLRREMEVLRCLEAEFQYFEEAMVVTSSEAKKNLYGASSARRRRARVPELARPGKLLVRSD